MSEHVLDIFTDYVCPFCWLAEPAILEFERTERAVRVVRRAFELRPDPVPVLDPQGEYLTRMWREKIAPLAREMNVPMQMPNLQPRTRLAHEAARFAAQRGGMEALHLELMRAFWERGEDIGRVEVLAALAEKTGLDGTALRTALEAGEFTAGVIADKEMAELLAVRSVPAFAYRHRVVTGVRTVEELRLLVS